MGADFPLRQDRQDRQIHLFLAGARRAKRPVESVSRQLAERRIDHDLVAERLGQMRCDQRITRNGANDMTHFGSRDVAQGLELGREPRIVLPRAPPKVGTACASRSEDARQSRSCVTGTFLHVGGSQRAVSHAGRRMPSDFLRQ